MPTFLNFNNRLPDPTFTVTDAGAVGPGVSGPGFASVSFRSSRPGQVSRTISGRGVHRETGAHTWEFSINYNPMRRDDFDIVQSFLDARNGRMNPFYVVLPQHSKPKDPVFAAYAAANQLTFAQATQAGQSSFMMNASGVIPGNVKPGDYFNVVDANDVNHKKTYKVTSVEVFENYQEGTQRPTLSQRKIYFMPPLTKNTAAGAVVKWINPEFRVIQKNDVSEYDLSTDNLYSYKLDLEEILP